METKKTEKASLENKRLLFAEAGLIAALLAVYGGFETSSRETRVALLEDTTKVVDEEDIIAITQDTPPPAPEAPALPDLSDEIQIVDDDIAVEFDFQSLEDTDIPVDIKDYQKTEVVQEEVDEDPIPFVLADKKPTFQGKDANTFSSWVNAHLVYPEIARENGVQGRVTIQFTIGTDGKLYGVRALNSPDESLSSEAVRVVSSSPKWEPGKQRDRTVKVTYTFPVVFRLM